jgi:hypothetical protein
MRQTPGRRGGKVLPHCLGGASGGGNRLARPTTSRTLCHHPVVDRSSGWPPESQGAGLPGVRSLWRGLRDLTFLVEGYRVADTYANRCG